MAELAATDADLESQGQDERLEAVLHRGFKMLRAGDAVRAAVLLRNQARRHASPELAVLVAQAETLAGDADRASLAMRAAFAAPPADGWARVMLARLLLGEGRAADALSLCGTADGAEMTVVRAHALIELGDPAAALMAFERLLTLGPDPAPVRHNMASLLTDLGEYAAAEAEARRALGGGVDAPETWVVLGQALQGQDRHEEAEAAFGAAIQRRPAFAEAHRRLANLLWMRTGDLETSLRTLDAAIAGFPSAFDLVAAKARVMEYAGVPECAYTALADAATRSGNPWLDLAAAQVALAGAPERAMIHAQRAFAAGARTAETYICLAEAHLAIGEPEMAVAHLRQVLGQHMNHQRALCLLVTAYRLGGDRRHDELANYEQMVRAYPLKTPDGWGSLPGYLADLADGLLDMHTLRAHPVGQSLRGGTQTQRNLLASENPAVKAFFQTIDAPIQRYIASGVLPSWGRSRGYRISGAWSVCLQPGGRHVSHMHPAGRISSACHIELPAAVAKDRQGWLCFGEPDVPTRPVLGPDHFVEPKCGQLVLFPSYLCHSTKPFDDEAHRLTIAFDVVPAEARPC